MKNISATTLWPCAVMLAMALAAVAFRPLMPIDETRYMTVAWEMRLHSGWLSPLTMNFEPYSHKPPMLFWLINLFWSVFGISRWAGLIPVVLASLSVVFLTVKLGRKITPAEIFDPARPMFLLLGSIPFLIYNTLMLFDLTLCFFVLASLLTLLTYAEKRQFRYILLMSLFTGLGLLTKGPVAYLYIIFPVLLAPLWVQNFSKGWTWYGHMVAWILLSLLPVLVWLVPVLQQSDNQFAFWLLWEQTAGRVAGKFNDAHIRPVYFYLPLLPLMFAPWIFFPAFWRSIKRIDKKNPAVRFLLCWIVPVFISFSVISGKQPHYLVPILPGTILLIAILLESISVATIKKTALSVILIALMAQAYAAIAIFPAYNLVPVASYVQKHQDTDWAFVRNYHGEIGFLARLQKPVANLEDTAALDQWFKTHPNGRAVVRFTDIEEVAHYKKVLSGQYRGKQMGIFEKL